MDVLIADVIGDVALVLVVSTLLSAVARWCRQPAVVGQILTGVLFGPSVLGHLPGHLTSRLFPHAVMPALNVLAQISVVIFMFVVGYELDRRSMYGERWRAALLVAVSALFIPMGLGAGGVLVFRSQFAALGQANFKHSFILFMAVAVSITALPVLAAIVRERGMAGSAAGATATTAAGLMDVSAWLVLAAALVGTAHQPGRPWPIIVLLLGCFVLGMLFVVRPALRWWINRRRSVLSDQLPVALALMLASAYVTASLGLHPVFGAFLAGLTMPSVDDTPDAELLRPMEEVGTMLLPMFFVVTGLSLNINSLNGPVFVVLAFVCVIASVGKLIPAYVASRAGGLRHQDAAAVAVLVNTRGLTELIALNVGLTAGIIGQRLFSVLVMMALIMTIITAPLLGMIRNRTETEMVILPADRSEQISKGL